MKSATHLKLPDGSIRRPTTSKMVSVLIGGQNVSLTWQDIFDKLLNDEVITGYTLWREDKNGIDIAYYNYSTETIDDQGVEVKNWITPTPKYDFATYKQEKIDEVEKEIFRLARKAIADETTCNRYGKTAWKTEFTTYIDTSLLTAWTGTIKPGLNDAADYDALITYYKVWESDLPEYPNVLEG